MTKTPPIYNDTLLLYTLEKCGTTTVMNTVQSAGIPIHRVTRETILDFDYLNSQLVTIVRDPVAWAVSYYLEMPNAHPDDIVEQENFGTVENFFKNVNPIYATQWHVHYFREIIGVSPYGWWFHKTNGWKIISLHRVLVLKTNKLSTALIPGLSALTGRPESDFTLHKHQTGKERYGDVYKELHRKVRYQRLWYVENIDETQYIRHFFSLPERKWMLEKWTI